MGRIPTDESAQVGNVYTRVQALFRTRSGTATITTQLPRR